MVKQVEDKPDSGKLFFFECCVIKRLQGFGYDGVDFALYREHLLLRCSRAGLTDRNQDLVAVTIVFVPFVSIQIATEPGRGRTDA